MCTHRTRGLPCHRPARLPRTPRIQGGRRRGRGWVPSPPGVTAAGANGGGWRGGPRLRAGKTGGTAPLGPGPAGTVGQGQIWGRGAGNGAPGRLSPRSPRADMGTTLFLKPFFPFPSIPPLRTPSHPRTGGPDAPGSSVAHRDTARPAGGSPAPASRPSASFFTNVSPQLFAYTEIAGGRGPLCTGISRTAERRANSGLRRPGAAPWPGDGSPNRGNEQQPPSLRKLPPPRLSLPRRPHNSEKPRSLLRPQAEI